MIRYNSKEWFKNLINFYKSYVLQTLFRYVVFTGIITAILCFLIIEVIQPAIHLSSGFFSLLGIVLSILLVFRTNTAYDRWWEGRKQWGALVNNTRTLAILLQSMIPDDNKQDRDFFAKHISNFCIALKEHLRMGVKLDELVHLTEEEKHFYKKRVHIPNIISLQIFNRAEVMYRSGVFSEADMINLRPHVAALLDIMGACERIKKTPIPFSYNVYIKVFILAYCLILPFGLIDEFHYYTIPLVMFVFFAMAGVELIGEEIEDPFGLDCNDLPTGTIAATIKNNVYEILCLFSEVEKSKVEAPFEKTF